MMRKAAVYLAVGNLAQFREELVPHGDDLRGVGLHVVHGLLERRGQGHDARHILRAAPAAPLLGAALDEVKDGHGPLSVEHAHALGRMEFMAGHGEHVNIHGLDINGHMARGLNRVGMKGNSLLAAKGANLRDGLNGANLVVGEHHGDKAGILPYSGGQILKPYHAVLVHVQQRYIKALFFKLFQGVKHCVVLKFGRNKVLLALPGSGLGSGDDGLVIGFASAGGKVNFFRVRTDAGGHGGPGIGQRLGGVLGKAVKAGGVAVLGCQIGQHGVQRGLADAGGGCIVGIYKHSSNPFFIKTV